MICNGTTKRPSEKGLLPTSMSYVLLLRGVFNLSNPLLFILRQTYKQFVDESIQIAVQNLRRATTATKTGLHTLQLTKKSAILDDITLSLLSWTAIGQ